MFNYLQMFNYLRPPKQKMNMKPNDELLPSAPTCDKPLLAAAALSSAFVNDGVSATTNCELVGSDQLSKGQRQRLSMSDAIDNLRSQKVSAKTVYQSLSPCETKTISELAEMIKKTGLYDKFSDKEFESLVLSRRPLELLFMANASIYKSL